MRNKKMPRKNSKKLTSEEIEKIAWNQAHDNKDLKNPEMWLSRAKAFHFTTNYVINDHLIMLRGAAETIPKKKEYIFSILTPFLYLLAITVELYLKGYLIAKGEEVSDVKAYRHNLKELRLKCLSYGDKRFDSKILPYITDTYGKILLDNGGLRYPGRKPPPMIFPDYVLIMDELRKILQEEIYRSR